MLDEFLWFFTTGQSVRNGFDDSGILVKEEKDEERVMVLTRTVPSMSVPDPTNLVVMRNLQGVFATFRDAV